MNSVSLPSERDKRAYFAKGWDLAAEYADCYQAGILEVKIPINQYDDFIKKYERPYISDPSKIELPLPHVTFPILNDYETILHPYPFLE